MYFKELKKLNHLLFIVFLFSLSACAYRFGNADRSLPEGYRQVNIPIFKNYSQEPSVEVLFTNALIQEFEKSKFARVTEPAQSEVFIEGAIKSINYLGTNRRTEGSLPSGTVLAASYDIQLVVSVTVRRHSDKSILWQGDFTRSRSYSAPQVTLAGVNTVNPLYNLSARRQNLEILANDVMAEAHDRITENF